MNITASTPDPLTLSIQPRPGELSTLGLKDLLGVAPGNRWRSVLVFGIWLSVLLLSIGAGIFANEISLTAIPVSIGAFEAYITIYPPLLFCILILFWMGFIWALIPAYIATLLIALYTNMPAGWAVLFAFSDTVGLAFLAIAYRSTGNGFDVRRPGSIAFFIVSAFIAALAGATGSFIWSHTKGLAPVETFQVWEGWWLGSFLQTVLVCGPLLFLLTPAVARLKTRWFGFAVHHERGAAMLTIAVLISVALVCAFLVGNAHLSRLRLATQLKEGYSATQLLVFADAALANLAWVSAFLILTCGLGFIGLTARWSKELAREVRVRTRLLEQGRKRIGEIIDLVPHMIFARDAAGNFVFANRATARVFGLSASELASSDRLTSLEDNAQLETLAREEARVFSGDFPDREPVETLRNTLGEERLLRTSRLLLEIDESNRPAVLTVAVDVTEQERVEAQLKELVDELADKNRELERFTYTVSHDLKSPIVTIRGFAKEMERQLESGNIEALRDDLARIDKASSRMQKLLDGLLVLSRSGKLSGPKQRVNMNRLVAEVIEILQGQVLSSNASISVAENLPDVSGDPVRLFELVQNLLENALKFQAAGTSPSIHIGCDRVGAENHFFIEDNGVGIGADDRERIFGLFEQLGRAESGTGIGLSLARRIAEVHGGRIWVESARHSSGSRFVFVLAHATDSQIE